RTRMVGIPTISPTTTLSVGLRWSIPLYFVRATRNLDVQGGRQLAKMLFFWFSMLLQRPSMSFGFLMKDWIAGIITVEAKSGRVSRSRNWAIDLAWETNSTDFFCRDVYPALLAWSLVAMTLGSALTTMSCAAADPT